MSNGSEQWRPVVGFEGLYEVSDRGNVRGFRPRALELTRDRHYRVKLTRQGVLKGHLVHVLVLEAFVGPRPPGLIACHNNGDGLDNRVENLRWDTRSANGIDAVLHGDNRNSAKTCCPRNHPYDAKTTRWQLRHETGRRSRVCRICRADDARNRRRLASTRRDAS